MPAPRWHHAALVAAAFVLYANVLPAPFVFDDERAIVVNEQIRHLSTSMSATEPGSPLAGRPAVSATFGLNYAVDGLNVRGYRLVNIALHAACAVLLLALLRLDLPEGAAFAAAMIWTAHPLVTEAVDYVSQRTELMMALCLLLTVYTARRARAPGGRDRRSWLAVSTMCCVLGMACKETMAVAPIVVLMYDRTFVFGSFRNALRARWTYYAGLSATWLVLVALLSSSPRGDSAGFADASVSPWEYLLNQAIMIMRYLRLAVWPRGLVLDYGEPVVLTLGAVAPYAALVAILLAAAAVAFIRWPRVGFLGAWFFVTLAPTSSIIPISTEVGAERRMYLPLMALVALLVAGAQRLTRHPSHRRTLGRTVAPRTLAPRTLGRTVARRSLRRTLEPSHVGVVLVVAALSVGTVKRNAEYLSGLTLWQSVLDRWPPHARARRNLAAELKLLGRTDEEIVHLRAAVRDLPGIRNLLGLELLAAGRPDEGIGELTRFLEERPRDPGVADARAALGSALLSRMDYAAAAVQYMALARLRPRDADVLSNLGIALAGSGRITEATAAFTRAVDVDPGNGLSQRNLALHLLEQNDFDGASRHGREAVRLTPGDPPAHNLLGLALVGQGRLDEAIREFETSLTLQPTDNDAAAYLERTRGALRR